MNKLASIYFLQGMGLHTVSPNVILSRNERDIKRQVDDFYYNYRPGWVLRCGELPDRCGKVEVGLPWDIVHGKEELVRQIRAFQKDVGERYAVFCHTVDEMVRGELCLLREAK